MKNCLSLSIASALLLAAGSVSAAQVSINPTPANIGVGPGGVTTPAALQVAYDNTGTTLDSIEFEITFDDADLDVTVQAAPGFTCIAGAGVITVIGFDGGGATLASGNLCALTFTSAAGATDGETFPLTFQNLVVSDGGNAATAPTLVNGQINVVAAPANPTTINFAPTTVNLANGGNVAGQASAPSIVSVTTAGGVDPGSYSCTVPAGFQLTNAAAAGIAAGSDPADISVTCTLAGAAFSGTSTCTRTGGTPVDLTLNCPAGAGPVLSSTPPSGTAITCNGQPGSTQTVAVTITNTGTAQLTGLACNVAGAGFALGNPAPAASLAPGASTNASVSCTVPAEGVTNAGTLNCTTTAPAGGTLTFPVTSLGQAAGTGGNLETIPSTSLWAKIGLVGLLAALGALVVGFRRNH